MEAGSHRQCQNKVVRPIRKYLTLGKVASMMFDEVKIAKTFRSGRGGLPGPNSGRTIKLDAERVCLEINPA